MTFSPNNWTAADEIAALRSMRADSCVKYCRLILADRREWDESVDVSAVKAEAIHLLAMLTGKGMAAHA